MNTKFIKTQNYSERNGQQVLAVVIHISEGITRSVIQTFTNPDNRVSAHYLVCRNGDIIQFINESQVAWHAGYKVNPTAKIVLENKELNPNLYTIGIEHEAFSNQDLTEIQYVSSAKLIGEICQRHGIPKDREHIIGHREIRSNKRCPGKVDISKIIRLSFSPPQISETESIQIKISLLQKIMELLKAITALSFFQRLGGSEDEKGL